MRGNYGFIGNGYAEELIKKIYDAYSSRVYLSAYDKQALINVGNLLSYVSSFNSNLITFQPPNGVRFTTEMIEEKRTPGDLRFEGKHPIFNLLASSNRLPSKRLVTFALITEDGKFISI